MLNRILATARKLLGRGTPSHSMIVTITTQSPLMQDAAKLVEKHEMGLDEIVDQYRPMVAMMDLDGLVKMLDHNDRVSQIIRERIDVLLDAHNQSKQL